MFFEGTGLQNLLGNRDLQSKHRFQNRSDFWHRFFQIFNICLALLEPCWDHFGPLLASWGGSGLVLGGFGHRWASTWGPWAQLGRLEVPFWSQKPMLDRCLLVFSLPN